MGLDAVVYKNKYHLSLDAQGKGALLEPTTGEVYFEDSVLSGKYPPDAFRAIHTRLGNLDNVAALRQEIHTLLGRDDTLVHRRVLYSAFHSGDVIEGDEFDALEKELSSLREMNETRRSECLEQFVSDFMELIAVARYEQNPIVFV